jgi:hypothetical protein
MIRINWQEQAFEVRRLVFGRDTRPGLDADLRALVDEHRLEVADDRADPRRGDFWVGCHPARGWAGADPAEVGWASLVEVPVILAALRRAAAAPAPTARG